MQLTPHSPAATCGPVDLRIIGQAVERHTLELQLYFYTFEALVTRVHALVTRIEIRQGRIRNGAWHDHYGNACNEARSFLGSSNKLDCGDLCVNDRTAGL